MAGEGAQARPRLLQGSCNELEEAGASVEVQHFCCVCSVYL